MLNSQIKLPKKFDVGLSFLGNSFKKITEPSNLEYFGFWRNLAILLIVLVYAAGINLPTILTIVASSRFQNTEIMRKASSGFYSSQYNKSLEKTSTQLRSLFHYYDYQSVQTRKQFVEVSQQSGQNSQNSKGASCIQSSATFSSNNCVDPFDVQPPSGSQVAAYKREARKLKPGDTFLVVGDSMIQEQTGIVFERELTNKGFKVIREGVYSTGFTNTRYFDWSKRLNDLIKINKPDAVVILMGSNDGQDIFSEQRNMYIKYSPNNTDWKQEYALNVSEVLTTVSPNVKKAYLIGLPPAPDPDFNTKFSMVDEVFQSQAKEFENVVYVDTVPRFAPNGQYEKVLEYNGNRSTVKFDDGVHLNAFGSAIAFEVLNGYLVQDMQ